MLTWQTNNQAISDRGIVYTLSKKGKGWEIVRDGQAILCGDRDFLRGFLDCFEAAEVAAESEPTSLPVSTLHLALIYTDSKAFQILDTARSLPGGMTEEIAKELQSLSMFRASLIRAILLNGGSLSGGSC